MFVLWIHEVISRKWRLLSASGFEWFRFVFPNSSAFQYHFKVQIPLYNSLFSFEDVFLPMPVFREVLIPLTQIYTLRNAINSPRKHSFFKHNHYFVFHEIKMKVGFCCSRLSRFRSLREVNNITWNWFKRNKKDVIRKLFTYLESTRPWLTPREPPLFGNTLIDFVLPSTYLGEPNYVKATKNSLDFFFLFFTKSTTSKPTQMVR